MYWGWSPDSGQMEMMDLRNYVDSIRAGYDRALEELYGRVSAMSDMYSPGGQTAPPSRPPGWGGPRRGRGRHDHGHHDDDCGGCGHDDDDDCGGCGHGRHDPGHGGGDKGHGGEHRGDHGGHRDHKGGHGCHEDRDCRCECCIVDADIVVYARCGEIRVIPIEVENDTRKDREDVGIEVSEFRSGGGRPLPWKAALRPGGPITIKGCSTARLELLVAVLCKDNPDKPDPKPNDNPPVPTPKGRGTAAAPAGETDARQLLQVSSDRLDRTGDVDECEVGYVTIRLDGCLVRPIVVAVAVLPDACGAYTTGCSCSSCC